MWTTLRLRSFVVRYECPAWGTTRAEGHVHCRGASPIRNSAPLGPYRRTMPRVLGWPEGGGGFLTSEVPLYSRRRTRALEVVLFSYDQGVMRMRPLPNRDHDGLESFMCRA